MAVLKGIAAPGPQDRGGKEEIEIGLFTEPGRDDFDQSHVILMARQPIRSGHQVLKFVTDRKPSYAGVDPYNFYIDRNSADRVGGGERGE